MELSSKQVGPTEPAGGPNSPYDIMRGEENQKGFFLILGGGLWTGHNKLEKPEKIYFA